MADFTLQDHGSICVLIPLSEAGADWIAEHIPEDAMHWGTGVAIEPRYVGPIVEGLQADDLTIME